MNFSLANCVIYNKIRTPWAKGTSEKINKKKVQIKDVYGGNIALIFHEPGINQPNIAPNLRVSSLEDYPKKSEKDMYSQEGK